MQDQTAPLASSSRRTFLAGSAGLAALSPAHSLRLGELDLDREIRIALVGCGGRGSGAAGQALSTAGKVKLVALADAFEDRVKGRRESFTKNKRLAARVDLPAERCFVGFDAYKKVMALAEVDLVILGTPPHFRPEHFRAAIAAGKHVFMEKPVAVDGHGVRQVLEAARLADQKKLCAQVGLQRHHQTGYLETMDRIHDGAIGRIVAGRAYWNMGFLWHKPRQKDWTDMEWQLRNWLYFTWLSGDHIVEQHIHNLDVINWAVGDYPSAATGMGGRQVRTEADFGHIFDHHAVEYEYKNGARMFSQCRQIAGCHNQVSEHLMGTKGNADMIGGRWSIKGETSWNTRVRNNPYQAEHDHLFAHIRAGKHVNEAHNGAKSTLTAIMGRMATYTGRKVTWAEAMASKRLGPAEYSWGALEVPPVPMPGKR